MFKLSLLLLLLVAGAAGCSSTQPANYSGLQLPPVQYSERASTNAPSQ